MRLVLCAVLFEALLVTGVLLWLPGLTVMR